MMKECDEIWNDYLWIVIFVCVVNFFLFVVYVNGIYIVNEYGYKIF